MKKTILLIATLLFSFEVEFTKIFQKTFYPNKDGYLIITKANLTFPFEFYKTKNGYIVDVSHETYLNNDFYPPKDTKFKYVKYNVIDFDYLQFYLIQNLKRIYKTCEIKKIKFLTTDTQEVITKPTTITLKYKVKMDCK